MSQKEITVLVKMDTLALFPTYKKRGDSGMDVSSTVDMVIEPGDTRLVPTGLYFETPEGYEIQVRPRSGLALKYGISILNSPGTIDAGFRNEVKVIMINHGKQPFEIKKGDRIAQLVFAEVIKANLAVATKLNETERGLDGFGSTGIKS